MEQAHGGGTGGRFQSPLLREALLTLFEPDFSVFYMVLSQMGFLYRQEAAYPLGGSLPMALALEKRYKQLGGQVQYQARVEKILVENGRAVGVRFEDGSEAAGGCGHLGRRRVHHDLQAAGRKIHRREDPGAIRTLEAIPVDDLRGRWRQTDLPGLSLFGRRECVRAAQAGDHRRGRAHNAPDPHPQRRPGLCPGGEDRADLGDLHRPRILEGA